MSIPLTLRCECGEVLSAQSGETVDCGCGRRYDTSTLPGPSIAHVRATQARLRLYAQLGAIVVIFFGLLGFFLAGLPGVAAAASLSAIIWWRVVAPALRRKHMSDVTDLPTWNLESERDA
jgi:hypothetical protein